MSKHNQWKSKHRVCQLSWDNWGCSEPVGTGFRGQSPLKKNLNSKEHLDWVKIDLNVVEISTVQDFKCTKN